MKLDYDYWSYGIILYFPMSSLQMRLLEDSGELIQSSQMTLLAPYYPKLFMERYRRDSTPWAPSVSTCVRRVRVFFMVLLVTLTDKPKAHLNLREQYLPYKKIIAEVLRDKCGNIRTVINKIENVGAESEFRTFNYEVLIGPDDLNVEVRENGCVFRFDYAKVYWNSKLEAEHTRLISL